MLARSASRNLLVSLALLFGIITSGCTSLQKLVVGSQLNAAAVAMPDSYSAAVTREILGDGGNAVDAAVASAFVLAVTYPEAGNIGGGGFMLIHIDGDSQFLDYRETAPAAATRDMYLDKNGTFDPRSSLVGPLASGVPGTVWGLWAAHQRYGTMEWADLVAPAVSLARDGFIVHEELARAKLGANRMLRGETNFDRHFDAIEEGEIFQQPELAHTLEAIAALGPRGFYEGPVADLIIAQMERTGGLISYEDLKSYEPKWRKPLTAKWRDYTITSAPPPSSGGIALVQLLKLKEARSDLFDPLTHNSSDYIHLTAEIEKRVFADRAAYLGDPDFYDVPVPNLIETAYLDTRALEISSCCISTAEDVPPGLEESPETTHFSILDAKGGAVSNTYTLNFTFGSGVVVEGAGFLLNNEMDDFSAKAGGTNVYGVIGSEPNAIAPNKRMLSSMSPTILLRDKEPVLILGTPGGSTIFTSVYQVITNILDFNMSLQEAVSAPRFHHQLPQELEIRFDKNRPLADDVIAELASKGYDAHANWWGDIGDVQAIWVRHDGVIEAASDPRGRGVAVTIDELDLLN
jgi:gamma-glutamyltranspeptidase/glutathione hydrolase